MILLPSSSPIFSVPAYCSGDTMDVLYNPELAVWKTGQGCPVANCPARGSSFNRPTKLSRHWNETHRLYVRKYRCSSCEFVSKRRDTVYRHARVKHRLPTEQALGNQVNGLNQQYLDPDPYTLEELFGQGDVQI